jgi:hypothetical protein
MVSGPSVEVVVTAALDSDPTQPIFKGVPLAGVDVAVLSLPAPFDLLLLPHAAATIAKARKAPSTAA